jgi:hypothetical protein
VVISARSRSSNSEGCSAPPSASAWICGARRLVDPVQPGRSQVLAQPRLSDHPAVADQHDVLEPEPALQLLDLRGQGARIARVAFEHFDGDRPSVTVAEETVDDLQKRGNQR